jgi:hypothetical protein
MCVGGIPSEERLLDFYCTSRGVAPPAPKDWAFYLALSIFRLLAILAGEGAAAHVAVGMIAAGMRAAGVGLPPPPWSMHVPNGSEHLQACGHPGRCVLLA